MHSRSFLLFVIALGLISATLFLGAVHRVATFSMLVPQSYVRLAKLSTSSLNAQSQFAQINFNQGYEGEAGANSTNSSSTGIGSPPNVSIVGNNPAVLSKGASYVDLGVSITDDTDADVDLKVTGASIDGRVAGTYTVTYTATDKDGNRTVATRTVIVVDTGSSEPAPTPAYLLPTNNSYPTYPSYEEPTYRTSVPAPFTRKTSYSVRGVMRKGDSGTEVKRLQRLLSQDSSLYPSQGTSGIYDTTTFNAIAAFQKRENITPSKALKVKYGEADFATRYRLEQLYSIPEEAAAEIPIPTFTNVSLKEAVLILTAQLLQDAVSLKDRGLTFVRELLQKRPGQTTPGIDGE